MDGERPRRRRGAAVPPPARPPALEAAPDRPAARPPAGPTAQPPAPDLLAELRESEARYRALVLAASHMVWHTDPDGNVLENTEAWEQATGQAQVQSNGWGWLDVVHPDDRPQTLEHWRRCLRQGAPYEREYRIRVDGEWRWVLARAVPVRGEDGRIAEWVGTTIDVDEAHRAADQREALLADLRVAVARTRFLQQVTADLAATRSTAEVAAVVREHLQTSLRAATGTVYLTDRTGTLRLVSSFGYPAWVQQRFAAVDAGADLPLTRAFRSRVPVFLGADRLRDEHPELAGVLEATGSTAVAALPLVAGGRAIGAVTAGADRQHFSGDDRSILVALATQAAQALERAQVVERLREVATDLQQGLAPGAVPTLPGVDLAATYRAGGDVVEQVGGDWYDVLPLDDGRVVLVVGDVMGRGVHAATTMAAVSAAVRAYALIDPDPRAAVPRIDAYVGAHAPDQFVTLFYGLLDVDRGRLDIVLAGHLPPLVRQDGEVRVHRGGVGQPLGLPGSRPVNFLALAPGDGVVILTDGAVERRDRSIDEGLHLARAAAQGAPSAAALARQVAALGDDADDVTVLAFLIEDRG